MRIAMEDERQLQKSAVDRRDAAQRTDGKWSKAQEKLEREERGGEEFEAAKERKRRDVEAM